MINDLTILIPTAGRPDMLRTALRSVERQTARARIAQVVISENLGDERSRRVAGEFPGLPVRYVLRTPPLHTLDHAQALLGHDHGTPYAAVLHDDDWWRPAHLDRSLTALDRDPQAAACYGGYWCVLGEESGFVGHQDNNLWWSAAGRPAPDVIEWVLPRRAALLATLGGALGHYSSLVARAAALRASTLIYQLGNPMDNDRLLTAELSRHGDLLYHPLPELMVRQHATQDFRRFDDAEYLARMSSTTRYVIQLARQDGFNLREGLEQLHAGHPEALRPYLAAAYAAAWCRGPLEAEGLLPAFLKDCTITGKPYFRLREWIPPAFVKLARRMRNRG